jgi:anti-anti-sigma factor
MEINQDRAEQVTIVAPAGRLDYASAPALERHLRDVFGRNGASVVVDFGAVEYVSSAALAVLLTAARQARDVKGRLVLCQLGAGVLEVFSLAGLLPLFTIEATRDAAVRRASCTSPAADR